MILGFLFSLLSYKWIVLGNHLTHLHLGLFFCFIASLRLIIFFYYKQKNKVLMSAALHVSNLCKDYTIYFFLFFLKLCINILEKYTLQSPFLNAIFSLIYCSNKPLMNMSPTTYCVEDKTTPFNLPIKWWWTKFLVTAVISASRSNSANRKQCLSQYAYKLSKALKSMEKNFHEDVQK